MRASRRSRRGRRTRRCTGAGAISNRSRSGRRTVWFDAANMPAICALDASFFEPGTRQDERFWDVSDANASEYRFPAEQARRELEAARVGEDGARTYRYTRDGSSVMATLD